MQWTPCRFVESQLRLFVAPGLHSYYNPRDNYFLEKLSELSKIRTHATWSRCRSCCVASRCIAPGWQTYFPTSLASPARTSLSAGGSTSASKSTRASAVGVCRSAGCMVACGLPLRRLRADKALAIDDAVSAWTTHLKNHRTFTHKSAVVVRCAVSYVARQFSHVHAQRRC